MSKDDLRFLEALRAHRESNYGMGLRPIAARPTRFWLNVMGLGAHAIAAALFAALLLLGGVYR